MEETNEGNEKEGINGRVRVLGSYFLGSIGHK